MPNNAGTAVVVVAVQVAPPLVVVTIVPVEGEMKLSRPTA